MSTQKRSQREVKTVSLGKTKVDLYFPGKISTIKKGIVHRIGGSYINSSGESDIISIDCVIDDKGVISLKMNGDEYSFTLSPSGDLVPAAGTDLFGGVKDVKQNQKAVESATEHDSRIFVLTKIVNRFGSVEDYSCKFDFFGLLMRELYSWLNENGHKSEAACVLSFATKNPFYGAVLLLQLVTPMRKDTTGHYISTKLLREWLHSTHADRVFGFSVREKTYAKISAEFFATAVKHFEGVKKHDKAMSGFLTSIHRNIGSKNQADNAENMFYNNILNFYLSDLAPFIGTRTLVAEENRLLPLHDAICLYELRNIVESCANSSPEDVICLVMRAGIRNAVDAQLFSIKNVEDEETQKDMIDKILSTNMAFVCQPVVVKTDIDFLK